MYECFDEENALVLNSVKILLYICYVVWGAVLVLLWIFPKLNWHFNKDLAVLGAVLLLSFKLEIDRVILWSINVMDWIHRTLCIVNILTTLVLLSVIYVPAIMAYA